MHQVRVKTHEVRNLHPRYFIRMAVFAAASTSPFVLAQSGPPWTESIVVATGLDGPRSVATGDFDGDGQVDVVYGSDRLSEIGWFKNTGSNPWPLQVVSSAEDQCRRVIAIDLDDDGDTDIVFANIQQIGWFENEGNGSSWTRNAIAGLNNPHALDVGDVDGDGDLDIVSGSTSDATIIWYENSAGDASFWLDHNVSSTAFVLRDLDIVDIDNDGNADIVSAGANLINFHANVAGDGSSWSDTAIGSNTGEHVESGDIDADGDVDIFMDSAWLENPLGTGVAWTYHLIPGMFAPQETRPVDIDSDGDLDLIAGANGVFWYENVDGSGSTWMTTIIDSSPVWVWDPVVEDMNGDGMLDVVSAGYLSDDITIYVNPGPVVPVSLASLCSGDGGDQIGCTNCPCVNNASMGTVGGCLNSVATSARLIGTGDPSVSLPPNDFTDLRFTLDGAPPLAFCILFSGDAVAPLGMANPCFGFDSGVQAMQFDGLRCAVMNTRRHGGRSANPNGDVGISLAGSPWGGEGGPPVGIAVAGGGFVSGQTRYFQVINRDDPLLSCMRGLNTSQAVEVTFTP